MLLVIPTYGAIGMSPIDLLDSCVRVTIRFAHPSTSAMVVNSLISMEKNLFHFQGYDSLVNVMTDFYIHYYVVISYIHFMLAI